MMRRRKASQAGMTLIEVLIAVLLFGAITASMGMVLNIALTSMNKIDSRVDFNRRFLASQRTLDHILQGIVPVNLPCAGLPVGILARQDGVRFLSTHSLGEGARGRPRIIELFGAASPNGGFRLLLNERLYLGRPSLSSACGLPFVTEPTSFILADKLGQLQFNYRRTEFSRPGELWTSSWIWPDWPSGIRIDMTPMKIQGNQLQPVTVFSPILIMNFNTDDPAQQQ
jgi:prepilin-type N-terminal cleavage/methylation domain-containing protein